MRVIIEILTGKLFYVEIKDDATVADLKREIVFQEQQLPLDRLILLVDNGVNGRFVMAEDGLALQEYGVEGGSHVYLFFQTMEEEQNHHLHHHGGGSSSSFSCHFLLSSQDFLWCHLKSEGLVNKPTK